MPETYVARNSPFATLSADGEVIVLSTIDSRFFSLNPVAAAIWQAADGITPLREIVAGKVCAEFAIDYESAREDAEQFIENLRQTGLILVSESPICGDIPPIAVEHQNPAQTDWAVQLGAYQSSDAQL